MDRIEFEEWSLKAIDPALAPRPWHSPTTPDSPSGPSVLSSLSRPPADDSEQMQRTKEMILGNG